MADSTIDQRMVILYDRWPGVAVPSPLGFMDMTGTAAGTNVATEMFPLGTKYQVWNTGFAGANTGPSTFIYLRAEPTATTAVTMIARGGVVPDDTLAETSARGAIYTVTGDSDRTSHDLSAFFAIGIATMTNSYYGWFWCGGVCPIEYTGGVGGALDGDIATDDSIDINCDAIPVVLATTGIGLKIATAGIPAVAYCMEKDGS